MSPTLLTGEDVNFTLRDLTMPLVRRKRLWMLTFLSVFAVAALIGLLRQQTYKSHMSILISREGPHPAEATEATRVYEAAIEDAESGLREFQSTQGRSDLSRDSARQLAAVEGKSRTVEHAIAVDEQKIRTDQEQMRMSPQQPAPQQDNDARNLLLQNIGARLQAAETKRAQFLQKYAPNYPLVQDANEEVSEAKAAITAARASPQGRQSPAREKLALDQADLAMQRASLSAIRQVLKERKAQMLKPGGGSLEVADLEREVKADEQSYLRYLSKREQERTVGVLDRPRAVSAASATRPAVPASPVPGRGVIFLAALGLAAAVSVPTVLILDCFDPCFHTPAQVIETLGIAVVLAVPKMTA